MPIVPLVTRKCACGLYPAKVYVTLQHVSNLTLYGCPKCKEVAHGGWGCWDLNARNWNSRHLVDKSSILAVSLMPGEVRQELSGLAKFIALQKELSC